MCGALENLYALAGIPTSVAIAALGVAATVSISPWVSLGEKGPMVKRNQRAVTIVAALVAGLLLAGFNPRWSTVRAVRIEPDSLTLRVGTATTARASHVHPDTVCVARDIGWSVLDARIASANASGSVRGLAIGQTVITAIDQNLGMSDSILVRVVEADSSRVPCARSHGEMVLDSAMRGGRSHSSVPLCSGARLRLSGCAEDLASNARFCDFHIEYGGRETRLPRFALKIDEARPMLNLVERRRAQVGVPGLQGLVTIEVAEIRARNADYSSCTLVISEQ